MHDTMPQTCDSELPLSRPMLYGRRIVFILLSGLLAAAIWHATPLRSANDRSRWATVAALVDHRTYQIDQVITTSGWDTIDKVRHEEHFYSTKPAALPTLAAGLYAVVNWLSGWSIKTDTAAVTQTILLVLNLLPFLIGCWCFVRVVDNEVSSQAARMIGLPLLMTSTLMTPFLITLNNHTIAATGLLLIIPSMVRLSRRDAGIQHFAIAGIGGAWICVNELPAAVFGIMLFLLALRQSVRKTWTFFVPAALIPLAAFFVTTWLSTGSWKPFYLAYGTEKYEYVHRGVPSYWMNPTGIDIPRDTPAQYLIHCTVGHHGILSLTPLFLFAIPGWIKSLRHLTHKKTEPIEIIHLTGLVLTFLMLGFYLSRTQNYNYGGNSAALRWALWLTPFWMLALLDGNRFETFGRIRLGFLSLCLLVSSWSVATAIDNPWKSPWLFNVLSDAEWISYDDEIPAFNPPKTVTLWSLPEPPDGDWVELVGFGPHGQKQMVRLSDEGREDSGRVIRIERSFGGELNSSFKVIYNEQRLTEGASFEQIVNLEEVPKRDRPFVVDLVSGMPAGTSPAPRYGRYLVRHLFTSARDDAFRCRRIALNRTMVTEGDKRPIRHRTDLWLSEEIPFGLIRWERSTYDGRSGDELSRVRLTLVRSSRFFPRDPP